jgi:hypothetical protein
MHARGVEKKRKSIVDMTDIYMKETSCRAGPTRNIREEWWKGDVLGIQRGTIVKSPLVLPDMYMNTKPPVASTKYSADRASGSTFIPSQKSSHAGSSYLSKKRGKFGRNEYAW